MLVGRFRIKSCDPNAWDRFIPYFTWRNCLSANWTRRNVRLSNPFRNAMRMEKVMAWQLTDF